MRMRRILLIALIALLLGGCGFKPRQATSLSPEIGPVAVVGGDEYDPVVMGLRRALDRAGVPRPANGERAGQLRLYSQRFQQGPVSVDRFVRVREYQIRYTVNFRMTDASGKVVVPRQNVELIREYSYDATRAAGSGEEQEVVREELQREMVSAILRRVDAALR